MKKTLGPIAISVAALLLFAFAASAQDVIKVDQFGRSNEEDEMARLDNFTIQLQNTPDMTGYIIVYGSKTGRRSEASVIIKRQVKYLVKQRGIDPKRIKAKNGGIKGKGSTELWMVREGASPPKAPSLSEQVN